jgi:hypothetical protein
MTIEGDWKLAAGLAASLLVLPFGCGMLLGKHLAPVRFETHETVKMVQDTSAQAEVLQLRAQIETLTKHQHRETVTVVQPDGTKTRRETVDTDTNETTDTRAESVAASTQTTHTETAKEVARLTVSDAPRLHVGVSLGVPVSLSSPFIGTPFVIGHADYTVLGPFSLGVWGSVDIHGANPAFGIDVGASL